VNLSEIEELSKALEIFTQVSRNIGKPSENIVAHGLHQSRYTYKTLKIVKAEGHTSGVDALRIFEMCIIPPPPLKFATLYNTLKKR